MGAYYSHLSDCERVRIMMLRSRGYGVRAISRELSRSPSTISDELKRNGHKESYSAGIAEVKSKLRRYKKQRTLHKNLRLRNYVFAKIRKGWSPKAISGKLSKRFGRNSRNYVSHETIYATIYAIPRGNLRTSLIKALRQSHKTRRPRAGMGSARANSRFDFHP